MKKYDSYKDSGVEWIGDLPSNWQIKRIKHTTYVKGRIGWQGMRSDEFLESSDSYVVTGTDFMKGLVKWDTCYQVPLERYEEDPFIQLREGDLLITKDGTIGKIAVVKDIPKIATLNSGVFLTRPLFDSYVPEFMYWILYSEVFKTFYDYNKSGSTIQHLYQNVFNEFMFPLPTIKEQTTIVNYLDYKTTQIDNLIAKKEQFIKLLEEERFAVINQAVTKGLNLTLPMKDSGIEWLGKIPEHWESNRIDWVANIVRGNTGFRKDELLDSGEYVALQYGKTYKVDIVDNSFNFFVNSEFYKESQIVTKGDTILISTSETIEDLGHTCYYINENKGLLGGEQILLKPNRTVLYEKYLYQYAKQFCRELQKYAKGLKVFRFSTHDLKQLFIAIPTIEEQIKIVDFLDLETIRIDSLISKMVKEIELLKEFKTALISEVVTGKVDVRN